MYQSTTLIPKEESGESRSSATCWLVAASLLFLSSAAYWAGWLDGAPLMLEAQANEWLRADDEGDEWDCAGIQGKWTDSHSGDTYQIVQGGCAFMILGGEHVALYGLIDDTDVKMYTSLPTTEKLSDYFAGIVDATNTVIDFGDWTLTRDESCLDISGLWYDANGADGTVFSGIQDDCTVILYNPVEDWSPAVGTVEEEVIRLIDVNDYEWEGAISTLGDAVDWASCGFDGCGSGSRVTSRDVVHGRSERSKQTKDAATIPGVVMALREANQVARVDRAAAPGQ